MSWLSSLIGKVPVVGSAINDVGKVVDPIARGAVQAIPGGGAILGAGDAIGRMIPSPGGAGGTPAAVGGSPSVVQELESLLGKAGGFLTGNGGLNALGVAQGVNAALQQKKAEDYAKNALGSVTQSYNERAPLRAQGLQSLQTAMKANPFATGVPQGAPPAPTVQPLMGGA